MDRCIKPSAVGIITDALGHLQCKLHLGINRIVAKQEIGTRFFGVGNGAHQWDHPVAQTGKQRT